MARYRPKYTRWSSPQEVHPKWIRSYGGVTNTKNAIAYEAKVKGYQIRFLKTGKGRIRFQIRERIG